MGDRFSIIHQLDLLHPIQFSISTRPFQTALVEAQQLITSIINLWLEPHRKGFHRTVTTGVS